MCSTVGSRCVVMAIAVFTTGQCLAATPKPDPLAEAYFNKIRRVQPETPVAKPELPQPEIKAVGKPFTFNTATEKMQYRFSERAKRLAVKWSWLEWHQQVNPALGEAYEASHEWHQTEKKALEIFQDAWRYAGIEWFWQTETGQAIDDGLANLQLRIETYLRPENGYDSRRQATLDVLFGKEDSKFPNLGVRISEKPELFMRFTAGGSGYYLPTTDGTGRQEVMLEHEFSWRIANVTKFGNATDAMQLGYQVDGLFGWMTLKGRYNFKDERISAFIDNIPVTDSSWISLGAFYSFKEGVMSSLEFDNFNFGDDSLTVVVGYYGRFSKLTDIFSPEGWKSPFMKKRQSIMEDQRRYRNAARNTSSEIAAAR